MENLAVGEKLLEEKLQLLLLEDDSAQPMESTATLSTDLKTCKRCKSSYYPSSNSSTSCRFHPSFFVSRRHDDQKRYYELGPNDPPYAAKFYDCCGAEEPEAPGCKTSFHISYDDI